MNIPESMDPADLILKDKSAWQKSLKEAKHIVDFYLDKLFVEIEDKRKLGKAVQEKVLPFVVLIESEIGKANFVEEIADRLGVPNKVIWSDLERVKKDDLVGLSQVRMNNDAVVKDKKNRKQKILRQISGIYWWQKGFKQPIIGLSNLEKKIKEVAGEDFFEKIKELNDKIKEEIIFEVEILYGNFEDTKDKVEELFKNLKIELIEEEIKQVIAERKRAEQEGDSKEALIKLKSYNELSKKRSKLLTS